jgi:ABC-type nitrate/sulfonate/bicarbonate transport system permease component
VGRKAARRSRALSLASFAAMLLFWTAITGSGLWKPIVDPVFLPSPLAGAASLPEAAGDRVPGLQPCCTTS